MEHSPKAWQIPSDTICIISDEASANGYRIIYIYIYMHMCVCVCVCVYTVCHCMSLNYVQLSNNADCHVTPSMGSGRGCCRKQVRDCESVRV